MSAWAISRDETLELLSQLGNEVEDLYNLVAELRVQMRFLEIDNERLSALAEGRRHGSHAEFDHTQQPMV